MSDRLLLAQINIAKMVAPLDSPVMADFVNNLDRINDIAERSEGFVWRLKEEGNNATSLKLFDDELIITNMSVWENIENLLHYVYKSDHIEIFARRAEWFERMTDAHMALWYVEPHKLPTPEDGRDRLMYLRKHGDTPFAFTMRKKFTSQDYIALKKEFS